MKSNHVTDILTDYLDGQLDTARHNEVEQHLRSCQSCNSEMEETRNLLGAFKEENYATPSKQLKVKFYQMLEDEKQNSRIKKVPQLKNNWISGFLKIAAGIALLIGAFALGQFRQQQQFNKAITAIENKSTAIKETAMLSLMENQSASKRIQGVNFIEEFPQPDKAIISALAQRMLSDQNTNVRLSAVEALGKFTNSDTVKKAFITALGTEKDPSIQIVLIHTLAAIHEKKAIAPLKKLLEQDETQPFVKREIRTLLPTII